MTKLQIGLDAPTIVAKDGLSVAAWKEVNDLFDGANDDLHLASIMEGLEMAGGTVETVAELFGLIESRGQVMDDEEEQLLLLPDGRLVLTDSEEGDDLVTAGKVKNIPVFIAKLRKIMED